MKREEMIRTAWRSATYGALALLALTQLPALAEERKPEGVAFTPRVRELLVEEMHSIKQASEQILNGLVVGDHSLVENMARQIHDSFILEKSLTEKDRKDLMKAAPAEFLHMDGAFHVTAKKLSEAARHKDRELELFYYSRMIEGCQSCHAKFAPARFPGFSGKQAGGHVH